MSLSRLADEALDRFGEYTALAFEGRQYTNLDQQRASSRLAHALRRLGVGAGDRVVVLLPNCPEVLQSYGAILKCGAVIVPLIFLLGEREVAHILGDSEAKVVITSTDLVSKVEGQIGVMPTLRHVLLVDGGGDGRLRSLEEESAGEPDQFPAAHRGPDDLAVILYTSGTTGMPKGVALSHANLESNARAIASLHELGRTDWAVTVLPLSHSYGLTVMNAGHILGTRGVLLRWFNPELVLQTIQDFKATSMAGVPTMLLYLLNYPGAERFDTRSMRVWGSGAAPLPVEVVEPFERKFGGKILEGYGLTEASPVVSAHRLSGARKIGSVGQAIPGVTISIQDDADRPLAVGEVGEVCVKGRAQRDDRLLPQPGRDCADGTGGVAAHRGHGPPRRRRLSVHRGAEEGPDHPRRVQHLPARGRRGPLRAPRDRGGGRRRHEGPADGRGRARIRGAEGRASRLGGRDHGLLRGPAGSVQVPEAGPLRAVAAQESHREGPAQGASHPGVRRRPWPT
jgi:long-chain acyl-CoA synthetase